MVILLQYSHKYIGEMQGKLPLHNLILYAPPLTLVCGLFTQFNFSTTA